VLPSNRLSFRVAPPPGRHLRPLTASTWPASSARFVMFGAMWLYLAVGFGVLIAFNVLVVTVMTLAARRAQPREELRRAQRARLITYVR
jgi:hypothetical protein